MEVAADGDDGRWQETGDDGRWQESDDGRWQMVIMAGGRRW